MKHQWQIQRMVKELEGGQKRWDRAYLLILELARLVQPIQEKPGMEVNHVSSDLCARVDPTADPSANH